MEPQANDQRYFKPENIIRGLQSIALWYVSIPFKLWRGGYSLPVAFWWFYVFGYLPATLYVAIPCLPFELLGAPGLLHELAPLMIFYIPFASVGVWRSSDVYKNDRWKRPTKIVVLVVLAVYFYHFANGGFEHFTGNV